MLDTLLLTVVYICSLLNKGLTKMGEPKKIKLTDAPQSKKANLISLSFVDQLYPEPVTDDLYIKTKQSILDTTDNENNKQDNPKSI